MAAGVFGGLLAIPLTRVFAEKPGHPPRGRGPALARQHARLANVMSGVFFASLLAGIAIYHWGLAPRNDWRVFCVTFGGGVVIPLVAIYQYLRRQPDNWAMGFLIAISHGEGFSLKLMRGMTILFAAIFSLGIGGYLFGAYP